MVASKPMKTWACPTRSLFGAFVTASITLIFSSQLALTQVMSTPPPPRSSPPPLHLPSPNYTGYFGGRAWENGREVTPEEVERRGGLLGPPLVTPRRSAPPPPRSATPRLQLPPPEPTPGGGGRGVPGGPYHPEDWPPISPPSVARPAQLPIFGYTVVPNGSWYPIRNSSGEPDLTSSPLSVTDPDVQNYIRGQAEKNPSLSWIPPNYHLGEVLIPNIPAAPPPADPYAYSKQPFHGRISGSEIVSWRGEPNITALEFGGPMGKAGAPITRYVGTRASHEFFPRGASVEFCTLVDQTYVNAPGDFQSPGTRIFAYGTSSQFAVSTGMSDVLSEIHGITASRFDGWTDIGFSQSNMEQLSNNDKQKVIYHELFHGMDARMKKGVAAPVNGQRAVYYSSLDQSFVEAFSKDVNRQTLQAIVAAGYAHLIAPEEAYAEVGARLMQPMDDKVEDAKLIKLFANTAANMAQKLTDLGIPIHNATALEARREELYGGVVPLSGAGGVAPGGVP